MAERRRVYGIVPPTGKYIREDRCQTPIKNLKTVSLRPPIDLLYANPTCADVVSRRGRWVLLWTDRIDMDAADQLADPYGTTFDRVSCYRLRI